MWWIAVILLALAAPVAAQNIQVLDCPSIASGSEPCIVIELIPETQATAPRPLSSYPLFDPRTMAPDTPELMREFLNNRTMENAQRFLAWQQAQQEAMIEAQHLLRIAPRPQPGEELR